MCVHAGSALGEVHLPEELAQAIVKLERLEKSLESRRWQEGRSHLKELQAAVAKLARGGFEKADENFLYHAMYNCGRLEAALKMGDRESSEDYYRDLHDLLLRLANDVSSGEPPALDYIFKYLQDAEDWNTKLKFREVVYELREVSRYFRGVYPMLEAEGVVHAQIWEFHGEINRAMAAAEVGSVERTSESLDRLKSMTSDFRSLFGVARVKDTPEDP